MNFSLRLMEAMAKKSLKQKELSELSNVPQGAISNYCNDKGLPSVEGLYRLAKSLDVSMEWLLGIDDAPLYEHHANQNSDNIYWKERAKTAEQKLDALKKGLAVWLKKF